MEHRMNVRIPLRIEVGIAFPGAVFITGHTDDVSFEGMYVRTGETRLPRHSLVQLEFVVHGQRKHRHLRLPALVVRKTANGVGLMFANCEEVVFQTLARLMEHKLSANAQSEHPVLQ